MTSPEQAENAKTEQQTAAPPPDITAAHEDHEEFRPSGAYRFALLMIVAYIIYFFLTYHEIVILRGGV